MNHTNAGCPVEPDTVSAVKLAREFRLVIECARRCAHSEVRCNEGLPLADIDWEMLISTARRHRMIPWVYRCLRACPDEEAIPSKVREQFRHLTQQIAMRSLLLTGELLRVLDVMRVDGIRAVPFKGPVLGALCYGDPSLRECDDIDLLVPTEEVWRATELLQAHGYDFWIPSTRGDQERLLRMGWAFAFAHRRTRIHLDLHWKFTASGFSFPFVVEGLWSRLKPVQLAGKEVLSFPPEDVILLHCVHGAKHQWERLEWIYALSGLVRSNPCLQWDEVLMQAQQLRAERMLLLGLALTRGLFDTELPSGIRQRIEQDQTIESLVSQAQMRLVSDEEAPILEAQQYAFNFRMRESWRDRVRYFFYLLGLKMTPTAKDHEAIPLPAALSGLYYAVRPFRLVGTYGLIPLMRFFKVLRSV